MRGKILFVLLMSISILLFSSCSSDNPGNEDDINTISNDIPNENEADIIGLDTSDAFETTSISELIDSYPDADQTTAIKISEQILRRFIDTPEVWLGEINNLRLSADEALYDLLISVCRQVTTETAPLFEKHIQDLHKRNMNSEDLIYTLKYVQDIYTNYSSIYLSTAHIKLYDPATRWESWINLDERTETQIILITNDSAEKIILSDYSDTDDYYFPMDISILLPLDNVESDNHFVSYEMLTNENGKKLLHLHGEESAIDATALCQSLLSMIHMEYGWTYHTLSQVQNIEKVQIMCNDDILVSLTNKKSLERLELLFSNAKCIGYIPQTPQYGPELLITYGNGEIISMYASLEDDLLWLPMNFHYDYGAGMVGETSINNLPHLLNILGLNDWPEEIQDMSIGDWIFKWQN